MSAIKSWTEQEEDVGDVGGEGGSFCLFVSVYNACIFSLCLSVSVSLIRLIKCSGGAPANIPPRRMTKQESQALTAVQSFDSSSSCCFSR